MLLQYRLRPPVAQQRLTWGPEEGGELVLRLKRQTADGRTTLATSVKPVDEAEGTFVEQGEIEGAPVTVAITVPG